MPVDHTIGGAVRCAAPGLFSGMARAAGGEVLPISADLVLGAVTAAPLRVGKVVVG